MDVREPLSPSQIQELRQHLMEIRDALIASLEGREDTAAPVDLDEPIGRLSRMEAIQQQKMAQATRRREEVRLRMVLAALEADPEDEYGWCKRCDEPVGYGRLSVKPEAPFCVVCQDLAERR